MTNENKHVYGILKVNISSFLYFSFINDVVTPVTFLFTTPPYTLSANDHGSGGKFRILEVVIPSINFHS